MNKLAGSNLNSAESLLGTSSVLSDEKTELKLFPSWEMRNDSHQSWMLSRSEIANMTAEEALILFERLAREINQKL